MARGRGSALCAQNAVRPNTNKTGHNSSKSCFRSFPCLFLCTSAAASKVKPRAQTCLKAEGPCDVAPRRRPLHASWNPGNGACTARVLKERTACYVQIPKSRIGPRIFQRTTVDVLLFKKVSLTIFSKGLANPGPLLPCQAVLCSPRAESLDGLVWSYYVLFAEAGCCSRLPV